MAETGGGVPSEQAARTLVAALIAAGVRHVCITPGSRSTPLTIAFARAEGIRCWLHLDERSSSFFALGLAKATCEPVALVCTSGTAAANFLPAVVEANLTRVPLIVLTADRPARLRDIGADQTIDQSAMFGSNVRWARDLPAASGGADEQAFYEACGVRAVRQSIAPHPGPVHLNVAFDEPLISPPNATPVDQHRLKASPAPSRPGTPGPSTGDVEHVARLLAGTRRPIIVGGPESAGLPAAEIMALAGAIGAPVFADALSGLRTGSHDLTNVLTAYDALVRDQRAKGLAPDAVIRFGAPPTSKSLNQYLAGLTSTVQVLCDGWASWRDPSATASAVVTGDPAATALMLAERLILQADDTWARSWTSRDRKAAAAMREQSRGFQATFEGRVFVELQDALEAGSTVFVGNSMPVRDLDSFADASPKPLQFLANRGANGIDGVVSTALGVAAVTGRPTILVIGDLSFYHDMNGLWAAARHGIDLTIVLVNNNGGGIFHYLPQAAHPDIFEEWFATPGNVEFGRAALMYGGQYVVVENWDEFRVHIAAPVRGLRVLEVRTEREANVHMHRVAWAAAAQAAWGDT